MTTNQFNVENKWYMFADEIRSVSGELAIINNVDISGNLEVQGDVSLNSNVDISRTLEVQGDVSFNSNVDISGNLEVQGDTSFNSNVDICGNLILKGSLGVLDSSTNDISYGNVGSVLTSNGSGALPYWRPPYYLNLGYNKYNTDNVRTLTSGTTYYPMGDFSFNSTEYPTQYNTSDFVAGGYWQPSQTGIYLFVAKTNIRSINDRMDILDLILFRTPSGGSQENFARVGLRTEKDTDIGDDLYYYSPILTTIIKIDTIGDKFRLGIFARTWGNSDLRLYEDFHYTSVEITKLG